MTVRTLLEKFVLYDQIGYLAFEFLDGKLVRNEAIKVIQMADVGKIIIELFDFISIILNGIYALCMVFSCIGG